MAKISGLSRFNKYVVVIFSLGIIFIPSSSVFPKSWVGFSRNILFRWLPNQGVVVFFGSISACRRFQLRQKPHGEIPRNRDFGVHFLEKKQDKSNQGLEMGKNNRQKKWRCQDDREISTPCVCRTNKSAKRKQKNMKFWGNQVMFLFKNQVGYTVNGFDSSFFKIT